MQEITIRKVEKSDIPTLVDIRIAARQKAYRGIFDQAYLDNSPSERDARIAKMESNYQESEFVVAEQADKIVGFCRFCGDNYFSAEVPDTDCELTVLYVDVNFQHQGVGSKLFNYAIQKLQKMGKRKMIIWCVKGNRPAENFYAKFGGKIIAEKQSDIIGGKTYPLVCFAYNLQ